MSFGITAAGWAAIGAVGGMAVSAYNGNKAANAQEDAANAAQATGDRQFDISRQDTLDRYAEQRADQAPYREAGKSALATIMAGVGSGGEFAQKFDGSTLTADPGYQFRLEQGQAALNRNAAATGAGYSGAALKALARFNSGLASQEYGDAYNRFTGEQTTKFNRLASLAGIGQTATNATQQAGTNTTGQLNTLGTNYVGNTMTNLGNAGEARASGYVSTGNSINAGIRGLYNAYQAGPWTTGGSGTVDNTLF